MLSLRATYNMGLSVPLSAGLLLNLLRDFGGLIPGVLLVLLAEGPEGDAWN